MPRRRNFTWQLWTVLATGTAIVTACGAFSGTSEDTKPPEGLDAGRESSGDADGNEPLDATSADANGFDAVATAALCPPSAPPTCTLAACPRVPLYIADAASFPFDIVTDSAYVYWLEQWDADLNAAYNGNGKARVLRVDRAGSTSSARAEVLAVDQQSATAIALVPPHAYWATWDGAKATSTLHRVVASCAAGACQEQIVGTVKERVWKLVGIGTSALIAGTTDGKVVTFRIEAGGTVGLAAPVMTSATFPGLAVTNTHIYASGLLTKQLSRADLGTLAVVPAWATFGFDGGELGLTNLATNCTDLFGFHQGGELESVHLDDAGVSRLLFLGRAVYGVAMDAKYLYAASLNGGGVVAIDPTTKGLGELAAGSFRSVAVDDKGVYWGDHPNAGGGTITMLVK